MKPTLKQYKLAVTIEQILFPIISLFLAYKNGELAYFFGKTMFINNDLVDAPLAVRVMHSEQCFYHIIMTCFCLLIAYMTLIRKNLKIAPSDFKEIFIPILSTFWFVAYNIAVFVPHQYNIFIMPIEYYAVMGCIGGFLSLVGICISIVAALDLRKSFGVLVQVRDVVTHGMYQYVRHPLYLGYVMMTAGFILLKFTLIPTILAVAHIMIIVYRAKLEEKKMAEHSEEYREYMARTPFILPIRFK